MKRSKPSSKSGAAGAQATDATPAAAPAPSMRRDGIAVVVALVALWTALFAPQLFLGKTFVRGDAGLYSAYADLSRERWAATRERTLWNPYVFMGIPSTASLADPRPQWLPAPALTAWDALTKTKGGDAIWPALLACLLGMLANAWLARRLWRCDPAAMIVAGALWGLAPILLVPLGFGHSAQTITVALMPASLLAAEGLLAAHGPRATIAWLLALAAILAFQALGGHPQFLFYSLVALIPFAVVRALDHARPARLAHFAIGCALGALLAAAQWLPALAYVLQSQRAGERFAIYETMRWSLAPRDLWSWAWPHAVGFGDETYWGGMRGTDFSHTVGMLGALLALVGLAFGGARGRRVAWTLGAIAVVSALLALGPHLPVIGPAVVSSPALRWFRTPMTWLVLADLAGALLAARGLQRLAGVTSRSGAIATAVLVAGLAVFVGFTRPTLSAAWISNGRAAQVERSRSGAVLAKDNAVVRHADASAGGAKRATENLLFELALVAIGAAAVAWAASRRDRTGSLVAGAVLATCAVASLGAISAPLLWRAGGDPASLEPKGSSALARAAARDPLYRAFPTDQANALTSDWIQLRARTLAGLHSTLPAYWQAVARKQMFAGESFQRACAVKYIAGEGLEGLDTTRYRREPEGVIVRVDALPRAYGVASVQRLESDDAVMTACDTDGWRAEAVAYTTDEVPGAAGPLSPPTIRWTRDDPDDLALDVRASSPGFVVLAEAYVSGWSARLDGRPVPLYRVNQVMRGVSVPAGEHALTLRYVPDGWGVGTTVSRVAWLVWLVAAFAVAVLAAVALATRTRAAAP